MKHGMSAIWPLAGPSFAQGMSASPIGRLGSKTVLDLSVDVAHGLVLLFGMGAKTPSLTYLAHAMSAYGQSNSLFQF